jgi:hypothetical protein
MRIDNDTRNAMFGVLRDKIVATGSPPKVIRFFDVGDVALCDMPFDDVEADTYTQGNFFFQDEYDSRILRCVVDVTGVASYFKIFDSTATNSIVSGTVSLLNAGGDIVFNSLNWAAGNILTVSSLKIGFPLE